MKTDEKSQIVGGLSVCYRGAGINSGLVFVLACLVSVGHASARAGDVVPEGVVFRRTRCFARTIEGTTGASRGRRMIHW